MTPARIADPLGQYNAGGAVVFGIGAALFVLRLIEHAARIWRAAHHIEREETIP